MCISVKCSGSLSQLYSTPRHSQRTRPRPLAINRSLPPLPDLRSMHRIICHLEAIVYTVEATKSWASYFNFANIFVTNIAIHPFTDIAIKPLAHSATISQNYVTRCCRFLSTASFQLQSYYSLSTITFPTTLDKSHANSLPMQYLEYMYNDQARFFYSF